MARNPKLKDINANMEQLDFDFSATLDSEITPKLAKLTIEDMDELLQIQKDIKDMIRWSKKWNKLAELYKELDQEEE